MLQLPPLIKSPINIGVSSPNKDDTLLRSTAWSGESLQPQKPEKIVKQKGVRFETCMDLKYYAPEEISVKTTDGFVVVEGKQKEKLDAYGFISRQFTRKLPVPEGCRIEELRSIMTPDGLLFITVPAGLVIKKDSVIPVKHEGTPKSKL